MTSLNNWKLNDDVVLPTELGGVEGRIVWLGGSTAMSMASAKVDAMSYRETANGPFITNINAVTPAVYHHNNAMTGVELTLPMPGASPRKWVMLVPAALLRRPKCGACNGTGHRTAR